MLAVDEVRLRLNLSPCVEQSLLPGSVKYGAQF